MVQRFQMKRSIFNNKYTYFLTGIFLIAIIYLLISSAKQNEFIYPSFATIFNSLGEMLGSKYAQVSIGYSFLRILLSICLSFVASLLFSFLYIIFKPSIYIIKPFLFILKVSPLAIVSLYLWLSVGDVGATYVVSFMVMFPLMIEANISAIDNISPSLIDEMRLNNVSLFKKFYKIYLPLISPSLIMSVLQCFGLGFKVVVMTEYLCLTPSSIGRYLYDLKIAFDIPGMLALLIVIIVIVAIFEVLISVVKWKINKEYPVIETK